jgi:hypothetical protein
MDTIILKALQALLGIALSFLTTAQLKKFADMAFDFIEDAVKESANPYDDAAILPVITRLRTAFDIPDNDDI